MIENEVMTSSKGGNFELAPAGNHLARICSIISLGTVDHEYTDANKKKRMQHKKRIRLGFELIGTKHVFKEENGPQPFVVYKEMTDLMSTGNNKSTLYKLLHGWLGEKFINKDNAAAFNLISLLGKEDGMGVVCLVNVIRTAEEGKDEFANIESVTPVPAGVGVAKGEVPRFLFNFNLPFKAEAFKKLGKKTQEKIQSSDEYKKIVASGVEPAVAATAASQAPGKIAAPAADDDLPF